MFEKYRRNSAANRLIEEQLFEQVVFEVSQGELRPGLWAKALANGGGSEQKAKSLYIQYRVQSIKDELKVSESIAEEANKIAESEYNDGIQPSARIARRLMLAFKPADTEVDSLATLLGQNTPIAKADWAQRLSQLGKGECWSVGGVQTSSGGLETKPLLVRVSALEKRGFDG